MEKTDAAFRIMSVLHNAGFFVRTVTIRTSLKCFDAAVVLPYKSDSGISGSMLQIFTCLRAEGFEAHSMGVDLSNVTNDNASILSVSGYEVAVPEIAQSVEV